MKQVEEAHEQPRIRLHAHPKLDVLIGILSLSLFTTVDLTSLPARLATLGYQLMLLVATLAVLHLILASKNHD